MLPLISAPDGWQVGVAWGAFLATVPSALWRVLMVVGWMPGTEDLRQSGLAGDTSLGYTYVFALSIVQLSAGFLTLGLVRPWGERFLGRRVPVTPVVVIAVLGGLTVVWLFDVSLVGELLGGRRPDGGLVSGRALGVMVACYIPILFWGPLELLATVNYWLRRRRPAAGAATCSERTLRRSGQLRPEVDRSDAIGVSASPVRGDVPPANPLRRSNP